MEEKKNEKTGEGKANKQRPPRRHGYFMEPPTEKKEVEIKNIPVRENTPADAKKKDERQGSHNHKNKHHHKKTENKPNDKPQAQSQTQGQVQAQAQPEKQAPVSPAPEQKKSGKNNRRNKNKHKSGAPKPSENKEQTVNTSEQKPQKNAPASKKKAPPLERNARADKPVITHNADDYEEYKWFNDEDETPVAPQKKKPTDDQPKTEVVGVRFKSTGKTYYFDPKGKKYTKGSGAIVDTARGQEYGEVSMANSYVNTSDIVPPLRHVIRAATTADVEHHKENKIKEEEALRVCSEKIAEHKLEMKLIDAQYTFDNSKLLFYFTSSDRVDFRELVKDLASVFRTRIELRQIGIRDEAKLMGGLGMCGRPLCCSLFLSDFNQVSIKMAKEQNLSLNSAKISGICGRLMCCLKYEHEAYEYEIKRTPPVDSLVRTENGDGIITEIHPLARTVKVKLLSAPEAPPKTFNRDEITMLRKKQNTENK